MSLTLQPNPDGSPEEYFVLHGALQVGRIYKRKTVIRPETQWLWSLSAVLGGPAGMRLTGFAGTLEEAKDGLKVSWDNWLGWAQLSEAEAGARRASTPQVISVVISKSEPGEQS
jgi:hypothetical protein